MEYKEEINSSMESALNNPLILGRIAKFLPEKSLMKVRFTNKSWYSIFSEELAITFKEEFDFLGFLAFHNLRFEKIEIPYRKFHFNVGMFGFKKSWKRSSGSDSDSDDDFFPEIERKSTPVELVKEIPIRHLTLYNFDTFDQLKSILEMFSGTLEFLRLNNLFYREEYLDTNEKKGKADKEEEAGSSETGNEIVGILMPKLKHLYIAEYPEENGKGPIQNLLKILHNSLVEITFSQMDILSFVLDCLIAQNPPNLKRINFVFLPWDRSEEMRKEFNRFTPLEDVKKLIQFSREFKSIEINFYGTVLKYPNVSIFFNIIALYNHDYSELIKSIKENEGLFRELFGDLHLRFVHKFISIWNTLLDLESILYHFPNLKQLFLSVSETERVLKNSVPDFKPGQKFVKMEELSLNGPKTNLDTLVSLFPNLTKLRLVFKESSSHFNICLIFNNLTKLRDLSLLCWKGDEKLTDFDFTGLSDEIIKGFKGKSYDFLKDFKIPERDNLGIAQLIDLERCWLSFEGMPTWVSFFFAFRFLPKLEFLGFHSAKKCQILKEDTWKSEYWNLFSEHFGSLELLKVCEGDISYVDTFPPQNLMPENLIQERPFLKILRFDESTVPESRIRF